MRRFKIEVSDKKHFESLIMDYRRAGFMLVTLWKGFAELENESAGEYITIEIVR
jgi:hypothetical protein